jgi:hypothetical protein
MLNRKNFHGFAGAALAAALIGLAPSAGAAIVSTEQMTAGHEAQGERARVQAFVERARAAGQLQALGVEGANARERIDALSDQEVHALAARIDALPAGGNFGSFTDEQVIIILLLIILVAVLI